MKAAAAPRRSTRTAQPWSGARTGAALALLASLLLSSGAALGHEPQKLTSREIVRLAGTFGDPPAGAKAPHDVVVTVQGRERTLHASDWQVFAVLADQNDPVPPAPDRVTMQGTREDLSRLAGARPEQRVAILAERRAGMSELFLLALDLCPEK